MISPSENTPVTERPMLWLDLQPEYIDVNMDKFVQYLFDRRAVADHDDFYRSSLALLKTRTLRIFEEMANHPIGAMLDEGIEREVTVNQLRILSLYCLVEAYDSIIDGHKALACMYLLLVRLMPEVESEWLLSEAVRALTTTGRLVLKYSWTEVRQFEPYILCQALHRTEMLTDSNGATEWYVNNGSAMLKGGALQILPIGPSELNKSRLHESLNLCDGRIKVCAPPQLRLSLAKQNDYDAVSLFFRNFRQSMVGQVEKPRVRYRHAEGDDVLLLVTDTGTDYIKVETVDPDYDTLSGLCYYSGRFRYNLSAFVKYLKVGQVVRGSVTHIDGDQSTFDLIDTFWDFLFDEYQYTEIGTRMRASFIDAREGYLLWWSEYGYVVSVSEDEFMDEMPAQGQVAIIELTNKNARKGFINGSVERYDTSEEYFDSELGRRRCVETFGSIVEVPERVQQAVSLLNEQYIRLLARVLYVVQKYEGAPVARYHIQGVVGLLCHLCGDTLAMHYVDFAASTLCNMVWFASGRYDRIEVPEPDASIEGLPGVQRRENIIYTLMQYRKGADEQFLERMIAGDDSMLSNLAQLVQSGNRLAGVLSGNVQRQIELEITRQLRVDDEAETDFSDTDSDYFGVEDDRKEFKTSFVFPPDNHMQFDPEEQRRNVFRGVCAMLNSREGGILYLGVNDHGKVVGLQEDLKALHLHTMDSYMRYISDAAKRTFGLELMPYIHLEATHEDRVVAMRIDPCDFKVVELEGVAYVRANAESRRADKNTRAILLARKLHFDSSRAHIESSLSAAMEHRSQVELKSYRPLEDATVADYLVEPFAFTKGNKHVWAYDLGSSTVMLFSLSRIGDVRLKDTLWQHQSEHKEGRMDMFRSTHGVAMRVQLQLDALAYNLLREEYDGCESELTKTKDGYYLLDTEVLGLEGIGRFYLGLARNITIVNAPGLKEWAAEYARQYLLD